MLITFVFKINLSTPLRSKTSVKVFIKGVLRSWVRVLMKPIQEIYLFPDCYKSENVNFEVTKNKVCELVCASLLYNTTDSVWRNFIRKSKGWKKYNPNYITGFMLNVFEMYKFILDGQSDES